MIERRVWLICTFSIFMHPTGIEQGDGQRPAIMDKVRWARRVVDESFPRHLASGVRFACGTDSMDGLMPVGLETRVRFGVSTHDALLGGRRQGGRVRGGDAGGAGVGWLVGESGTRPAGARGQRKRGGTLRGATVDKPVNMDPGYAQLYSSLQVYQNVYNKLVYVDESGQFI